MAAINFTYCMQGATRTFPSGITYTENGKWEK